MSTRDGKWPHDHCKTCGADQGAEAGQCAIDFGGEHAETEEWSEDWVARASKAESELATLRARVAELSGLVEAATLYRFGRYEASEHKGRWFVITILADGDPDWHVDNPMTRDDAIAEAKRLAGERV